MAEKKGTKKTIVKSKKISRSSKAKSTKSNKKKIKNEPIGDGGIIIVDDDIIIDQDKINEERRAYLEEARSQEAVD